MTSIHTIGAALLVALSIGCSSSDTAPTADSGGAVDSEADAMDNGDGMIEDAAPETAPELKAPTVTNVMKMSGALHVNWRNNQTGCTGVEVERKTDTDPYKVVFTVPGTVNNKMDASATANTTYTYRLRCKMGTDYSPYSNEMSKNPTL